MLGHGGTGRLRAVQLAPNTLRSSVSQVSTGQPNRGLDSVLTSMLEERQTGSSTEPGTCQTNTATEGWRARGPETQVCVDANWKQTGLTYLVSPLIQFVQTSEKSEFRHAYGPKEAGLEIIYLE